MATRKAEIKASISMDDSSFQRGLRRSQNAAAQFARKVEKNLSFGSVMARTGTALAAVFAAGSIRDGLRGALLAGERLKDLNAITGISIRGLSKLSDIFEASGAPVEDLEMAIARMQKSLYQMQSAGGKTNPVFRRMNLNFEELLKMAPEEQFLAIGKAIKELPTAAERTGVAMKIFGRSGAQLLEIFEELGDADLKKLDQRAAFFERNAAVFDKVNTSIRKANMAARGFWLGLAENLLPTLEKMAKIIEGTNWEAIGQKTGQAITGGPVEAGRIVGESLKSRGLYGIQGVRSRSLAEIQASASGRQLNPPMSDLRKRVQPTKTLPIPYADAPAYQAPMSERVQPTSYKLTGPKSGLIREPGKYGVDTGRVNDPFALKGGISQMPVKTGSLLSKRERNKIQDDIVAAGGVREGSTPGAFNAYRQGDAKRRKAFLQQQEREQLSGQQSSEKILSNIAADVSTIAGKGK